MNAARDGPVEPQSGQMRANGGVDDIGGRVVLARDVVHRRNVDARDVRFSHTGYDVGETLRVPPDFQPWSLTDSATRIASWRAVSSSAASTITRTICSVPEGRNRIRPVSPSSASASATAERT